MIFNITNDISGKASASHTHVQSDVTDLVSTLTNYGNRISALEQAGSGQKYLTYSSYDSYAGWKEKRYSGPGMIITIGVTVRLLTIDGTNYINQSGQYMTDYHPTSDQRTYLAVPHCFYFKSSLVIQSSGGQTYYYNYQ